MDGEHNHEMTGVKRIDGVERAQRQWYAAGDAEASAPLAYAVSTKVRNAAGAHTMMPR